MKQLYSNKDLLKKNKRVRSGLDQAESRCFLRAVERFTLIVIVIVVMVVIVVVVMVAIVVVVLAHTQIVLTIWRHCSKCYMYIDITLTTL